MRAWWALAAALGSTSAWAAPPLVVGVVPLGGEADATTRGRATQRVAETLSGVEGVEVVALSGLDALTGPGQAAALEACGTDEACVRQRLVRVRTDRLVLGTLDPEGGLRLRLVDSATTAGGARVVVSRTVELGEPALTTGVTAAVMELFPERADRSYGRLVLQGGLPDAAVWLDGAPAGALSLEAPPRFTARVRAGEHAVRVSAPGHAPFDVTVTVMVGRRVEVSVALDKNRSAGPLYLAGGGVVAAGVALALGLAVNARASAWREGCPVGQPCAAGFTRDRLASDADFVDGGRLGANVLWGTAAAALIGAGVWYLLDPGEDEAAP